MEELATQSSNYKIVDLPIETFHAAYSHIICITNHTVN